MRTALVDADSRVASLLASSHPERLFLPQRLGSYAVRGDCSLGRTVPLNESLLSHFERPLRPTLQMGVTVRDAMALEASCRAQSEALSYSMSVLSGLLGLSVCRTSSQLILRCSIISSPLCPRASPMRRRLPLPIPLFSATVARSFTSHTCWLTLATSLRAPCFPLLWCLPTPSFVKRMSSVS